MSLVPFPAPSTTAPTGAPGLARPAARTVVAPFAGRAHAGGRGEHAATPGRAASQFAHVLASVQAPKETMPATSDAERAVRADGSAGAVKEEKSEAPDGSPAPVTVPIETSAAPVQTPWLLLALGSGTYARVEEEATELSESSSADCFAPGVEQASALVAAQVPGPAPNVNQPTAEANAAPAPAMPDALAGIADVSAAAPDTRPAPLVRVAEGASEAPLDAAFEVELPAATPFEPAMAGTGADDAVLPSIPVGEPDAAPPALKAPAGESGDATPAPEIAAADARAANPAAAVLARWHAAARRSGGDGATRATVATGANESAAMPRTPGLAASRLAQALGAASGQQPSQADGQPQPVSTGLPSPRPADVLTGVSVGARREGPEPGVSALSFGQVLAATAPGATPLPADPSAAAATASLAPAAGEQVLQQLVSSIKMQWKDGVGEAKLHLRPDALGAVSVSLRVEGGAVTAVVRAESAQVQEWVLQHQQTLRQQMEAAGLRLDELVVSPDDQRQQAREESSPEAQRRRPRGAAKGARGDDEPRFELHA